MVDVFSVLDDTNWAALTHAYGSAADTPVVLATLLSGDPDQYGTALGYLDAAVLHQGRVYPATAPTALFVAGILDDPRTTITCTSDLPWEPRERPLRAALVEWLGSVAASASRWDDEPAPPDEAPLIARCQAIRRTLYDAAIPFLGDPDDTVRAAALSALRHILRAPDLTELQQQTAQRLLARARDLDTDSRVTTAIILGTWDVAPQALLTDPELFVRNGSTCNDESQCTLTTPPSGAGQRRHRLGGHPCHPGRAHAEPMALMMCGRSSATFTTASTEPTSTARWMSWMRSNSAATSPSFSARTATRDSASRAPSSAAATPLVPASRVVSSMIRLSAAVRWST
jgi:hypothetical protein